MHDKDELIAVSVRMKARPGVAAGCSSAPVDTVKCNERLLRSVSCTNSVARPCSRRMIGSHSVLLRRTKDLLERFCRLACPAHFAPIYARLRICIGSRIPDPTFVGFL